jgi:hypothetical protein
MLTEHYLSFLSLSLTSLSQCGAKNQNEENISTEEEKYLY